MAVEITRRVASAYGDRDEEGLITAVREGTTVLLVVAVGIVGISILVARSLVLALFPSTVASALPGLPFLLMAVAGLVGIQLVVGGLVGALTGLQRGDLANWSAIAAAFCSGGMLISGLYLGLGIWSLLVADGVQMLVYYCGSLLAIRRVMPMVRLGLSRISVRRLGQFAVAPLGLVVSSAAVLFDSQVDKVILSATVGPSAAAVFQIGTTLALAGRSFAVAPLTVLVAGTAELIHQRARLEILESVAVPLSQCIAAVTAGGFVLFAGSFIPLWIGPDYHGAILSMRIMAVATGISMWNGPWSQYLAGRGKYSYIAITAGVIVVLNAACSALLTTRIGLDGALIGSVAGSAGGALTGWLLVRRVEERPWFRPVVRAFVPIIGLTAAAAFVLPGRIESWWGLIVASLGYAAIGFAVLAATGALPLRIVVRMVAERFLNLTHGSVEPR